MINSIPSYRTKISRPLFVLILITVSPSLAGPACPCPSYLAGLSLGTLESTDIDEASGLAASRAHPGVFWVHNDSGDSARVFALNRQGQHLGIYNIAGASATDWEDMALGPGPIDGQDYLYLGDIGDNSAVRSQITVYRIAEPNVDPCQPPITTTLTGADTITLQYPDGARDAETLMVDPVNRDLYIISKRESQSRLYRAAYPQSTTQTITMQFKAQLPWGWATGGDISPYGRLIIVRGYFGASLWRRPPGTDLWDAFSDAACSVPLPLVSEPQGEAIAFDPQWGDYYTVSENAHQPLYYFENNTAPCIETSSAEFNFSGWLDAPAPQPQVLSIVNMGAGPLDWDATHSCSWLTADPAQGTSSGQINEITLSVDATGLTAGQHDCELTISDPCASNDPQTVMVHFDVGQKQADFTENGIIDTEDLLFLVRAWLSQPDDDNWHPPCDLHPDLKIDLTDFDLFATNWLWQVN